MKRVLSLVLLLAIMGGVVSSVFAQEATPAAEEEIYTPRLLPDSPFYFLKRIKERIELFLAQSPEAKAEKYAEFATRRIAEAKQLVKKGKPEFVERLMARHQEHLDKAMEKVEEAKAKGRDVERIMKIVAEATSIHQGVLTDVYKKVPEKAKQAIEKAVERSNRGQEKALEAISKEKRKELRQHLEERIKEKKPVIKKILEKRIKEVLPESEEECVCIMLWEPVCGVDGKTYSNECRLGCAGVEKAHDGECEKEVKPRKLEFKIKPLRP